MDSFWQAGEALATFSVYPARPEVENAILERVGDAPFSVGRTNLNSLLLFTQLHYMSLEKGRTRMQALHAVWNEERIILWAESSTLPLSPPKTRGRKPKKPKPRAHPFALSGYELREVIRNLSEQTALKSETKALLLPSTQKGPLPSPWLIREEDYSTEKATELLGWNIETLSFETPNLAFEFLLGLL